MSINDVHEELMTNLSAAMDMGKFLGVFNTLIGVIRDQQTKIDELSSRSSEMQALIEQNSNREPAPVKVEVQQIEASNNELVQQLLSKIDALEGKLNDTLLDLHGFGEDKSILDREDDSADFLSMENSYNEPAGAVGSKQFHVSVPPINENGEDGEEGEEGSKVASAVQSARNSVRNSQSNSRVGSAVNSRPSSRGTSQVPSRRSSGRKSPSHEAIEGDMEGKEHDPELSELVDTNTGNVHTASTEAEAEADISEVMLPNNGSSSAKHSRAASPYTSVDALNSGPNSRPNTGGKSVTIQEPTSNSRQGTPTRLHDQNLEHIDSNSNLSTADSVDWQENSPNEPFDANKLAPHALAKQTQAKIFRNNTNSPGGGTNQAKGLLQVTPLEQRPSAMQHSFSTKMHQHNSLFPTMEHHEVAQAPVDVKAQWKASINAGQEPKQQPHLHARIVPHYAKHHLDPRFVPLDRLRALADYREIRAHDHHDKIQVHTFKLLTYERRQRLCRLLRQKGRFIQISRGMLEESRVKYAARSLKQNVEFVEAETRRLFNKVKGLQSALKKQHHALRYLVPLDFHETFDRVVDFLEHLETKGGMEEFMALPKASSIVCYDETGNLPRAVIDAIATKLRPVILQELIGVKSQVGTLKEESINYAALAELFTPETTEDEGNKRNSVPNKERDLARRRMMTLIQTTVSEDRRAYLDGERRILEDETRHQATVGGLIHQTGTSSSNLLGNSTSRKGSEFSPGGNNNIKRPTALINSGVARSTSNDQSTTNTNTNTTTITKADTAHIDEQLTHLATSLETLQNQYEASKHSNNTEMSLLQSKLEQLEQANHVMMEREGELREQRKKDTEQLKIMQKRLATVSVDNVLDELKLLQLQVNDRPSTTDVSNMMEGISHTFRKHLGENVVGLRGLVDQVYRQIHHKVNREDIKKLISAKLATMEQDILRREQEMFSAASSTRCMSCGQLPPDPTNAFVGHTAARKVNNNNHHHSAHPHTHSTAHNTHVNAHNNAHNNALAAVGVYSNITDSSVSSAGLNLSDKRPVQIPTMGPGFLKRPGSSPHNILNSGSAPTDIHNNTEPSSTSLLFHPDANQAGLNGVNGVIGGIDDDISLHSEHHIHTTSLATLSTQNLNNNPRSEEIYNVMTGSAGLKSLMPQHAPMMPVQHPYNITNNNIHPAHTTSKRKPHNPNAIPEPLYRKAKLASHLKEMVKVSSPSAQNYGFNSVNPFFVVEGYSEESVDGGGSLQEGSLYSTASNKGGKRPKTTQGAVYNNNNNSQVYVPIPRGSTQNVNANNVLLLSASTGGLNNISSSNEHAGTVLPSIR